MRLNEANYDEVLNDNIDGLSTIDGLFDPELLLSAIPTEETHIDDISLAFNDVDDAKTFMEISGVIAELNINEEDKEIEMELVNDIFNTMIQNCIENLPRVYGNTTNEDYDLYYKDSV